MNFIKSMSLLVLTSASVMASAPNLEDAESRHACAHANAFSSFNAVEDLKLSPELEGRFQLLKAHKTAFKIMAEKGSEAGSKEGQDLRASIVAQRAVQGILEKAKKAKSGFVQFTDDKEMNFSKENLAAVYFYDSYITAALQNLSEEDEALVEKATSLTQDSLSMMSRIIRAADQAIEEKASVILAAYGQKKNEIKERFRNIFRKIRQTQYRTEDTLKSSLAEAFAELSALEEGPRVTAAAGVVASDSEEEEEEEDAGPTRSGAADKSAAGGVASGSDEEEEDDDDDAGPTRLAPGVTPGGMATRQ